MISAARFLILGSVLLLACGGSDGTEVDASTADATTADAGDIDASPPTPRLMYVSTGNDQRLAVIRLEVDGTMTALDTMDVPLGANTGAMTYARQSRRLFIGTGAAIATLTLDGSGAPSLAGTTTGTGNPVYIEISADESHMVTAYFGDDLLRAHDISGVPPHNETDSIATLEEPHAALRGPGGRFYVPHRTGTTTRWFNLSSAGILSLGDELAAVGGVGPRHIAFTPDESFAYVVNEFDSSVTAHTVAGDGSLAAIQTITTLPESFAGMNTGADIHVSPDGTTVYSSNRGHDSIAMFSINADGTLSELGQVATETTPREFDVSPDGRFVVVCGQGSGFLQSYSVGTDGALTAVSGDGRLDVGGDLRWVIID